MHVDHGRAAHGSHARSIIDLGSTTSPPTVTRISDARMSGTAFGTVILHVAPESAIGGPLALVQEGDWISLDVEARSLRLEVSDEELARRRASWKAPAQPAARGYVDLFLRHVQQANLGADFDFLVGKSGSTVSRESHA